ncbi:MAG TPA: protein kinase, partial [Aggregatilineales bacterium]|nr:protein kinase [Aggregatilineales bacterium]
MAAEETILNGRYQLVAQQGSGGMAVVYKATDLALSRSVAIKILRPSLTSDPQFLVRFRQEARNVANLAHPNIVTLHDVGQDGNTYYMVMEFIDGQDLKKIVRSAAPLSVERVMNLTVQICAGLGYAHRSELVHADVKPQNILMTSGDMVKITDFGIAQAISQTQAGERQRTNVVWGSPHYFAPEQARGEPPTPASDVYAIGVVMFEMLTGKLPYSGNSGEELALAHVKEQIPHVRDVNPSIPQRLDWLVHKVMSKEPEQRYRNADQLGRILAQIVTEGMGSSATPPKPPTQAAPKPVGTRAAPNVIMPDKSSPQPPPDPSSGAAKPVFLPPVAPIQSTPQPYAQPYQP